MTTLYLSNCLTVTGASDSDIRKLYAMFTYPNPKFIEAAQQGRYTGNIPKEINLTEINPDGSLHLPIGLFEQTFNQLNNVEFLHDRRKECHVIIPFNGKLFDYQKNFVNEMLGTFSGIGVMPTGAGKTISALNLCSRLSQRTLILVKSKALANQWIENIKSFTGCQPGLIGGGKNAEGVEFTVALIQTMVKRDLSKLNYGHVICDECHQIPALNAYKVINGINSKHKTGLTATVKRRDKMEFLLLSSIGVVSSEQSEDVVKDKVLPVIVHTVKFPSLEFCSWQNYSTAVGSNKCRNDWIKQQAVTSKTNVLILCTTTEHCENLKKEFVETQSVCIHGKLNTKDTELALSMLQGAQYVISTYSYFSEALDYPHLQAVILAGAVSARIDKGEDYSAVRLVQSIGRCRRIFGDQKETIVIDIQDQCKFGKSAASKRRSIYKKKGFKVL